MKAEKTGFTYHDTKSQSVLMSMIRELENACEGRNITVSQLIQDADGDYSENNFLVFLDQLIDSYPRSFGKLSEDEKDYLKTLLYVCIRACQANLNCTIMPQHAADNYELETYNDDSLQTLRNLFVKSESNIYPWSYSDYTMFLGLKQFSPVTEFLAVTVDSLYTLLTEKYVCFPTPYPPPEILATEKFGSVENAEKEIELQKQQDEDYEHKYEHKDEDFEAFDAELEEERESIKDPQSRIDYYQDFEAEYTEHETQLARRIFDLNDPKFVTESRRLKFFFSHWKDFIARYDHLTEIMDRKYQGLESKIPTMIDHYLKTYNLTLYKYPEAYAETLDYIYRALDIVKRNQEK